MNNNKPQFIYYTATTINGYIADSNDNLEWLFSVDSETPDFTSFFDTVKVLVMGSNTYKWLVNKENLIEKPQKWQSFFGNKTVYVFSHNSLPGPKNANIKFIYGSVANFLDDFINEAGNSNIWIQGGGDLAGQFYDCRALNEIHLSFAPVFLESGKHLLPRNIMASNIKLVDIIRTGEFIVARYNVIY
jgi:dihydrofolate reductase